MVPATVALLAAIGAPVVFAGNVPHITTPVYATTVRTCGATATATRSASGAALAVTGRTTVVVSASGVDAEVSDDGSTLVETS
jgi:hypothetical protein